MDMVMTTEMAVIARAGRNLQWALLADAERVAQRLGFEDAPVVPVEYMLRLADMGDQTIVVPVISIAPEAPGQRRGEAGHVAVEWAPTCRLTSIFLTARETLHAFRDPQSIAHVVESTPPGRSMSDMGVACLLQRSPDERIRRDILLLGDARQAIASMDRMLARECSLAEGAGIAAEAMRAVAAIMGPTPPPDAQIRRLHAAASAILACHPHASAITVACAPDGNVRILIDGAQVYAATTQHMATSRRSR